MSKQKHIAIKASKKSISSMILSILMLLSMIPLHSSIIYADGSRKTVMNGTGNISKNDVIYFGVGNANMKSHANKPIKWRALDTKNNTGEESKIVRFEALDKFDEHTDKSYLINEQSNRDEKTNYSGNQIKNKMLKEQVQQTKYTITMVDDGNGTATVDGKQQAEITQGTLVDITAIEDSNSAYKFKKWEVLEGVEKDIFHNKDALTINPWNFKMPAKNITIKATFEKKYNIEVKPDKAEHGTAWAKVGKVAGDKTTAEMAGTEIILEAEPNKGYKFVEWQVESGNVKLAKPTDATTTFTMPAENVTIKAIFEPIEKVTISFDRNGGAGDMSSVQHEKDTNYTLPACSFTAPVNKEFDVWEVNNDRKNPGEEIIVTGDTVVKALWKNKVIKHKITVVDGTQDKITAAKGEKVRVTAIKLPNKVFYKWTATGINLTPEQEGTSPLVFTMPDNDVKFTANFEQLYKIDITNDGNGTAKSMVGGVRVTKAEQGKKVTITATPNRGYKFDEWRVLSGGIRLRDEYSATTTFTMPDNDVEIKAYFQKKSNGGSSAGGGSSSTSRTYNRTVKQEQPSKPITPPTNNNKPTQNNIIKKQQTTVFTIGSDIVNIDGKAKETTIDAKPFLSNGRVMIPVRYVAESLGMQVEWNKQTQTVVLKDRENTVMIPIKTNKIIVGNQEYTSDVTPILKNGRTYLTISNIAKALRMRAGQDVKWDNKIKQVTIIKEVEVR